ncbi:hypothetical protein CC86DRAFT_339122 [Ophiobolus disseminans]|uniref:Uncharacterized protein n=1 Tax=Ophiobolus disseminans TaxID=1469910 RepID=A0A6A7AKJ6_9PLEO|nr:hypothetical protein CC86DRAFT_339122 [Ophiobolus disseminans]
MASFGNVLNLLDERYLNLHDVVGNVEPMPTLVPYQEYAQDVIVMSMDTEHELFMGLMHDFTARLAQGTRKEIWTWLVQWEVDSHEDSQPGASAPSPKKPRLEAGEPKTESSPQEPKPRAPIIDIFDRCVINAELMKEEDLLRILIDIVQADSMIVPNFIEFLYRWIDYYEGDGTALKAALKWEIPSLWDFEYHPLVLPGDIKKEITEHEAKKRKDREMEKGDEHSGTPVKASRVKDLAQGSPTKKMREKPNLATMERQAEDSERLQYREVKYGIRPPNIKLPLPQLINIPRGAAQRAKYYAACFKSRHRALVHLMESGLSMQQISNYQKLQKEHPKDTPETSEDGSQELKGLRHYFKDADQAQDIYKLKEKLQLQRAKQKEIAISDKLAVEAQHVGAMGATDNSSGIPLIPPTPSYDRPPDVAGDMMRRIQAAKLTGPEKMNFVPTPIVGWMKSSFFEGAKDPQSLPAAVQPAFALPRGLPTANNIAVTQFMSPEQAQNILPLMNPRSRTALAANIALRTSNNQVPMLSNATVGATRQAPQGAQAFTTTSFPSMASDTNVGMTAGANQPRSTSLPYLPPPPIRPPTVAGSRPTLPFLPPPVRPPASAIAPSSGPTLPPFGQRSSSLPSDGQPSTYSLHQPSQTNFSSGQVTPRALLGLPMPPQASRPQQANPRASAMRPLPASHFPPLPGAPGHPPHAGPSQPRPVPPPIIVTPAAIQRPEQHQPILPPPSGSMLSPPRPGIQRNAPTPLNIPPAPAPAPPSPFTSLAPSLLATTPFLPSDPLRVPIQIYFPKIVVPGNRIGPGGTRLGTDGAIETDALLVGHTIPGSGKISLSKVLFLPVGVWSNTTNRLAKGAYHRLETYAAPPGHPALKGKDTPGAGICHAAVYQKLVAAYNMMRSTQREHAVTKRWRASKGPMTQVERGAVWEGYGVTLDRAIEMSAAERLGADVESWIVDEGTCEKPESRMTEEELREKREQRELEELVAAEEEAGWDWDEYLEKMSGEGVHGSGREYFERMG